MNSMTDLRQILLDASQSGAYFFDEGNTAALTEAARTNAFFVADIDLSGAHDKPELMERLAAGLQIPAWFGGNWDGLSDVLTDLSWLPENAGVLICLSNSTELRDAEPNEFDTLLEVLNEAAFVWADAETPRPFWAILPMAGDQLPDA